MTKRSELVNNFQTPRRQSYAAIVLIIYKFYKIIIRQIWPFLLFILLGSGRGKRDTSSIISILLMINYTYPKAFLKNKKLAFP